MVIAGMPPVSRARVSLLVKSRATLFVSSISMYVVHTGVCGIVLGSLLIQSNAIV
jgi:hypothetical protein